jgi:hypothetical protein
MYSSRPHSKLTRKALASANSTSRDRTDARRVELEISSKLLHNAYTDFSEYAPYGPYAFISPDNRFCVNMCNMTTGQYLLYPLLPRMSLDTVSSDI